MPADAEGGGGVSYAAATIVSTRASDVSSRIKSIF